MNPEILEALMLICFGSAWPFSIYKLLKTKQSNGKSLQFLVIVLAGYIFGFFFEFYGQRNIVILLYVLNTCLISVDLALTIKYRRKKAVPLAE